MDQLVPGLIAFAIGLVFASLVEYWVHRLMHVRWLLGKKHAQHHRDGWGQGWFGEFLDYFLGSLPVMWLGFLHSVSAGVGFALAALVFATFAAYAHQLQHDRPELTFWMPRPVHYLHHHHHMWRHNFGISVDVWDRVFGTYKKVDWNPEPKSPTFRDYFRIHWGHTHDGEVPPGIQNEDGVARIEVREAKTEDEGPKVETPA